MTDSIHSFAGDFPLADLAAWREEADKALKGAPFDRLIRKTLDGVERGPLFTRADVAEAGDTGAPGAAPFIRGRHAERDAFLPWGIRQRVDHPDPKVANAHILEELQGGASEIQLKLDPLGEQGTAARTLAEFQTLLDGVLLDLAPLHITPSRMAPQYAAMFLALLEGSGIDPASIQGGMGLSPIGQKSLAGGGAASLAERLERTSEAAIYAAERFPHLKTVSITASAPHEAGGSEAHEIAFACGGGASYMRAFIDHGMSPDEAANALEFTFSADADIHLTIAKLRAARRAWSRVAESFGVSADKRAMALNVVTSGRMLTARDPYTNLIRNTCAGLGAAAGGADSIAVRPFTDALGHPTRFARRMARNLHVLLMEESHLGKVADPAGGGFLHETLAARLAETGWAVFQAIEARGGLFETVKSGWLQEQLEISRAKRRTRLAQGKDALIGISTYPQLEEKPVETDVWTYHPEPLEAPVIEPQPFAGKIKAARDGAQIRLLDLPEPEWKPVIPIRLAEPFEALRERADALADSPRAFLATLGDVADFNARATFAANRLAVGGVAVEAVQGYDDIIACTDAAKASGARLAVICGSDAAYGEHAASLAKALKAAGFTQVWIAGKPADFAGVDHFIHMRSDALEDGERALDVMGAQ